MDYVVVFLMIIEIIIISFYAMFVSIITLVAETILFPWLQIIGEKNYRAVMWRQLVTFK